MHLGLIGGIGPAATTYYYRRLVSAHAGATPLELTGAHADMPTLLANLTAEDPGAQARHFAVHVEQLAAAGARSAALTSIAAVMTRLYGTLADMDVVVPPPQEAKAVVLAGTDFFLAFEGARTGVPVLDCAEIHVAPPAALAC